MWTYYLSAHVSSCICAREHVLFSHESEITTSLTPTKRSVKVPRARNTPSRISQQTQPSHTHTSHIDDIHTQISSCIYTSRLTLTCCYSQIYVSRMITLLCTYVKQEVLHPELPGAFWETRDNSDVMFARHVYARTDQKFHISFTDDSFFKFSYHAKQYYF